MLAREILIMLHGKFLHSVNNFSFCDVCPITSGAVIQHDVGHIGGKSCKICHISSSHCFIKLSVLPLEVAGPEFWCWGEQSPAQEPSKSHESGKGTLLHEVGEVSSLQIISKCLRAGVFIISMDLLSRWCAQVCWNFSNPLPLQHSF